MIQFMKIFVTSGYGHNTRQPFVQMSADAMEKPIQLSPEDARDLASNLLQAAEASEQDAFIFEFHSSFVGGDERVGANMLVQFRKWRDEHGQGK